MTQPSPTAPAGHDAAARPLVPARTAAAVVIGIAVACFAAMSVWLHDTHLPVGIDTTVADWLRQHTGSVFRTLSIGLTEPVLTIGTCAAVTVIAALFRRWTVAALAVIGPLAGLFLESYVFKPLVNRVFGYEVEILTKGLIKAGYGFPSGHETGVTSAAMLLVVLALRTTWSRRTKLLTLVGAAVWTAVGALGLVRSNYHFFTDTLGGILLGVAVMLVTALLIDLLGDRVSSLAGRARSRTAPAA